VTPTTRSRICALFPFTYALANFAVASPRDVIDSPLDAFADVGEGGGDGDQVELLGFSLASKGSGSLSHRHELATGPDLGVRCRWFR
jgi:hypothetical protein